VRAERLLVGDGQVDQRPLRSETAARERLRRHRHGRREVQHVDRAAAPHLAVDELAAVGITAPAVGVGGDDVGVTHEHERRGLRVGALDAGDEAGPSRQWLVALDVEPRSLEVGLENVDAARLVSGRVGAVVDAAVADQLLEQLGDFAGVIGRHRPEPT